MVTKSTLRRRYDPLNVKFKGGTIHVLTHEEIAEIIRTGIAFTYEGAYGNEQILIEMDDNGNFVIFAGIYTPFADDFSIEY